MCSSAVQDVAIQSTNMEVPDDELPTSVSGERQSTSGKVSVQMSVAGERSSSKQTVSNVTEIRSSSNIRLVTNYVDDRPTASHAIAESDSRPMKTAKKATSSASAVSVAATVCVANSSYICTLRRIRVMRKHMY